MLRLYILRHAKTAWPLPGQRDFDRMLNERGLADLKIVNNWITDFAIDPRHVYCSPSARTRGTYQGIVDAFKDPPDVEFLNELYSGTARDYLEILHAHPRAEALMIVGHNPSCASLAHFLAGGGEPAHMGVMAAKYPTAAMAVLDFDLPSWQAVDEAGGNLVRFLTPKAFRRESV